MDARATEAFAETARRFAEREVQALVGTEGRDGDLEALPRLLERAEGAGLLGGDYGVWGAASQEDGPGPSVAVLAALAEACAGVAAGLHFAGLGAACGATGRGAVAWLSPAWRLDWAALRAPPVGAVRLRDEAGALRLEGEASFVHAAPGCERLAVFAEHEGAWALSVVPIEAPGLRRREVGRRCGLAATEVAHYAFEGAPVEAEPRSPQPHLRRLLLGLCALSLGNARGALAAARAYSTARRQGGALIARHAAVRLLLGDAASRVAGAAGHLEAVIEREGPGEAAVWRAAAARLRISEACHAAVSDCLQVFGGYGYMEDYRLEKRLRDAMTLRVLGPGPDTLRQLCAEPVRGALR